MNIFGFIFEKKKLIWSKNAKISFRQFKLMLAAERGYSLFVCLFVCLFFVFFFKKDQSV